MSKISISAAEPVEDLEACKFLHKRFGIALSSGKRRLEMGREGLFYTTELFLNDHAEKDKDIRDILVFFSEHDIPLFIMEIPHDMEWGDIVDWEDHRIAPEEMFNILDAADGEFS